MKLTPKNRPSGTGSPAIEPLRNSTEEPAPLDPLGFPHQPQHGSLPGTLENLRYLLEQYGISVRYNVIEKRLSIISTRWPGGSDNVDNTAMANIVSLACLNRFPRNNVEAFVAAIGDARPRFENRIGPDNL